MVVDRSAGKAALLVVEGRGTSRETRPDASSPTPSHNRCARPTRKRMSPHHQHYEWRQATSRHGLALAARPARRPSGSPGSTTKWLARLDDQMARPARRPSGSPGSTTKWLARLDDQRSPWSSTGGSKDRPPLVVDWSEVRAERRRGLTPVAGTTDRPTRLSPRPTSVTSQASRRQGSGRLCLDDR